MMAVEEMEMARTCDDCRDRDARVRCFACFLAEQAARRADRPAEDSVSDSSEEEPSPPDEETAGGAPGARLNDGQIAHRRAMLAHLTYKLNH